MKKHLNRNTLSAIILIMLSYSLHAQTSVLTMELNNNWEFRQTGTYAWLTATVPGTVHTDLLNNKIIEDPYYRLNERSVQWIDKVNWEYRTTLNLSAEMAQKQNIILEFEGLDTYADVFINDHLVLSADNMFRTWTVDVKNQLKQGENQVRILLKSPIVIGLQKQEALGFGLPAGNDQSVTGGLGNNLVSMYTRKAGYHFGWDWGPRLVTSGIWRKVNIQAWDNQKIENIHIIQKSLSSKSALLNAEVEISAYQAGTQQISINVNEYLATTQSIELQKGTHSYPVNFEIKNPKLWWPNGLGEQILYKITTVLGDAPAIADSKSVQTGLRTIKLVRNPDADGKGESFYFEVNGRPVFMKGANYIPNDVFLPRVTTEKYENVVKTAAQCNINMLRVWGGGTYENDIFYDFCDKYGILVWQDFMFACTMYPGDSAFLNNVRNEAVDNVKRLRNHPSIALWCGNNEIESMWAQWDEKAGWGYKQLYTKAQRDLIWSAYDAVFHHILPGVVTDFASDQAYWHSSPSAGYEKLANYETRSGDMHYWGVWHGLHPFSDFRKYKARFMSEYGFQSFPEFKTIQKYTIPTDYNIESEVMASHQRSGIGNLRIKQYMEVDYKIPADFEKFLYIGQVLQAEGIKMAVESHRQAMPYCQGSLYWQINDCWPVASWSSMDYYQRWKALQYFSRDAFKNSIISTVEENGKIKIFGISDLIATQKGILRLKLIDFQGITLWEESVKTQLPANSSEVIFETDTTELLGLVGRTKCILVSTFESGKNVIDTDYHFFARVKDLKLVDPGISLDIMENPDAYSVTIHSENLAKNLFLSSTNSEVQFSDNFMDILPGETVTVTCPKSIGIEEFKRGLKYLTVYDTTK
jgi:beta-mannosidase